MHPPHAADAVLTPDRGGSIGPAVAPTAVSAAVLTLLDRMTLQEKLAQLVGHWDRSEAGEDAVAPMQEDMVGGADRRFEQVAMHGLGHLTRIYGTRPIEPEDGRQALREAQRFLVEQTRLGIPAIVHEECLTGLVAWRATTFPAPLSWGASFDPDLVEQVGSAIGDTMAALGVHQGLAPVLDVVRDARWGRVEECIGEDPYLVGSIGTAYVRGVQSAGVVATLKHFVGYSASRAGRNLAPASVGPREVADVLLPPFEMAVLDGGARSVMHSYAEIDGVPVAADADLLTGLLRERWGFDGTVVADYFGVAFLHSLHGVARDLGDAAAQALAAGVDIELPSGDAYLAPLAEQVRSGAVPMALVDRAVLRVLAQKESLGLLDPGYLRGLDERGSDAEDRHGDIDLDPPAHRALAARLAEESVVLVTNRGVLPLVGPRRVAVVGPNADRAEALFGCYSFVNHVLAHHPGTPAGIDAPTVREAVTAELPLAQIVHERGCGVDDDDRSGIAAAVEAAAGCDVAVVVVGDQAGLFGGGTVGEGCDRDDLELPGVQRDLVEAVLATGTPVVLVLLTGRPYAVDWALEGCAAVVQAFFPGEEGAAAVAGVLSGRINPSGRMPVSLPRSAGAQPYTYLHPPLAGESAVSNLATRPAVVFGHGLSYTSFRHEGLRVAQARVPTDSAVVAEVTAVNTGRRRGADVVQLYGHDAVASVTRPVAQLLGYARVELDPGERAIVRFTVPATRVAFSDRRMVRVVEPGQLDLWCGASCIERETTSSVELVGEVHEVGTADARNVRVEVVRGAGLR